MWVIKKMETTGPSEFFHLFILCDFGEKDTLMSVCFVDEYSY